MSSNLPPGVTQGMIDRHFADPPCEICGHDPDDCICPECPVCEAQGDKKCYREHGLTLTPEQIIAWQKVQISRTQDVLMDEGMLLSHLEEEAALGTLKVEDHAALILKPREPWRHGAKTEVDQLLRLQDFEAIHEIKNYIDEVIDQDPGAAHEPDEPIGQDLVPPEPVYLGEEWEVEFASRPGERIEIHEFADVCIEAAARDAGLWDGMDSKQFPSFTVYHNGQEVGGG